MRSRSFITAAITAAATLCAALLLCTSCGSSRHAAKSAPALEPAIAQYYADSLEVFKARCQTVVNAAYMAGTLLGERNDLPGWEGYPVQLWEYKVGPDAVTKGYKKGLVYMLNPDAEQLARWIVNAVYDVTGELKFDDLEKVRKFIMWQSGAQFPVSGVVYEAMYVKDFEEPYVFKDGVTVYVADQAYVAQLPEKECSEEQLQYYLTLTNDQLKENTGRYARICSTTREMYYKAGGTAEVGKSDDGCRSQAWLAEVARLYQEAWGKEKNFLIYAWALSNLE